MQRCMCICICLPQEQAGKFWFIGIRKDIQSRWKITRMAAIEIMEQAC